MMFESGMYRRQALRGGLRCKRAPVLVTDLRTVMNRSIFVRKNEMKVSQIESSKHKLNREASG